MGKLSFADPKSQALYESVSKKLNALRDRSDEDNPYLGLIDEITDISIQAAVLAIQENEKIK